MRVLFTLLAATTITILGVSAQGAGGGPRVRGNANLQAQEKTKREFRKVLKGLKDKLGKRLIRKLKKNSDSDQNGDWCKAVCDSDPSQPECQACCTAVPHRVDWFCNEPWNEQQAECCTNWTPECYTVDSGSNNNHACKKCLLAVEEPGKNWNWRNRSTYQDDKWYRKDAVVDVDKKKKRAFRKVLKGLKDLARQGKLGETMKEGKQLRRTLRKNTEPGQDGDWCKAVCAEDPSNSWCRDCCTNIEHEVKWHCDKPENENQAECCTNWTAECYTTDSEQNNSHACNKCDF